MGGYQIRQLSMSTPQLHYLEVLHPRGVNNWRSGWYALMTPTQKEGVASAFEAHHVHKGIMQYPFHLQAKTFVPPRL